jgi:translation elongation factor EF-1alpha
MLCCAALCIVSCCAGNCVVQADVAVLVISSRKGEYETGFEKGGQTREHAQVRSSSNP